MTLGKVIEIWRYPVKSMGGEQLERSSLGELGIPGDRGWALRDEKAREIRGAKKFPALLLCNARYLEEPSGTLIPPAEIALPDGTRAQSDDPEAALLLSQLVGRQVSLWPRRPPEDLEHYRRRLPEDPAERIRDLREMLGRLEDEPLPDFSVFPREILEFTSPLGTYFDAFPLHFLTTASLRELARLNPEAVFDRRRFRPNFLIELEPGTGTGFVEFDWCGRELSVGEARVWVEMPVVRCSMTTQPQGDLLKDPSVLRTIVRHANQNVGVYVRTLIAGEVRIGDTVEFV